MINNSYLTIPECDGCKWKAIFNLKKNVFICDNQFDCSKLPSLSKYKLADLYEKIQPKRGD